MKIFTQLLTFLPGVQCLALNVAQTHHSFPLPLRILHQFPLPTYLQSAAVRTDGDIYIVTNFPDGSTYSISGATTDSPNISHIHRAGDVNAATGITETQPGVFNILAGRQSDLGVGVHGSFSVFELDTRFGKPAITELVRLPDNGLVVGVIPIQGVPNTLLVSDSTLGKLLRVNTRTRKYEEILQDPSMIPPPWAVLPFGIGGMQMHKDYLYYVSSFRASIYRIRFTKEGYPAAGAKVELVVALRSIYIDNFVIGPGNDDTIWAATNADNRLFAITPDGTITVVAGAPDDLTVAGVVGGAFGRLSDDANIIYLITSGGMLNPINGTLFEGGKVLAMDTTSFLEKYKNKLSLSDEHLPSNSAKPPAKSQLPVAKAHSDNTVSKSILEIVALSFRYIVGR
ncbi:MAG: hypothetical protein Q9213_000348 [Squamulea squamosa]